MISSPGMEARPVLAPAGRGCTFLARKSGPPTTRNRSLTSISERAASGRGMATIRGNHGKHLVCHLHHRYTDFDGLAGATADGVFWRNSPDNTVNLNLPSPHVDIPRRRN